jgi:hypothetical protein
MSVFPLFANHFFLVDMEKDAEKLTGELQEHQASLEKVQNQQSEDSRSIARQQKNTERYLAKKQMLMGRKDECNRNIRDLGVLPEEAFEKYTNEKLDRVRNNATANPWIANTGFDISSSKSFTQSTKASRNLPMSTKRHLSNTIISPSSAVRFCNDAKTLTNLPSQLRNLWRYLISEKMRRLNGLSNKLQAILKKFSRSWFLLGEADLSYREELIR